MRFLVSFIRDSIGDMNEDCGSKRMNSFLSFETRTSMKADPSLPTSIAEVKSRNQ